MKRYTTAPPAASPTHPEPDESSKYDLYIFESEARVRNNVVFVSRLI